MHTYNALVSLHFDDKISFSLRIKIVKQHHVDF